MLARSRANLKERFMVAGLLKMGLKLWDVAHIPLFASDFVILVPKQLTPLVLHLCNLVAPAFNDVSLAWLSVRNDGSSWVIKNATKGKLVRPGRFMANDLPQVASGANRSWPKPFPKTYTHSIPDGGC